MNNNDPNKYSLDQCWKPIQKKTISYITKIFGGQLPGYSDIEKEMSIIIKDLLCKIIFINLIYVKIDIY